jgi:hypothetical protein
MMLDGALFTIDYLEQGITQTAAWKEFPDAEVDTLRARLLAIFDAFPYRKSPHEPHTEDDLIWEVLRTLGWDHFLRQQALAVKGKEHVPDGLLFADADAKARANRRDHSYQRYADGLAIVESKRWDRQLDRRDKGGDEIEVPSSQMLRYLRRLEDLTDGRVRWGILTNGRRWRLYFQGAKSVSEEFLELDLAAILGLPPYGDDLFAPRTAEARAHWLRVFILMFRCAAFVPSADGRTFHEISLDEGRFYEEHVARNLSDVVFEHVFPDLARALVANDPDAPPVLSAAYLDHVKEAALILLYRLLFVLFAEDRLLLPVHDPRYDDYGLRERVRLDVARRMDAGDAFSDTRANYWHHAKGLFDGIARGDASIGLPPYNGGLFAAAEAPLLERVRLPDSLFARVIDRLGRVDDPRGGRRYVNYRDLSVQQLGSIYERLLEYDLVPADGGGVDVRLNVFARKGSGSYYTPDELVRLIIGRTVGTLIDERIARFAESAAALAGEKSRKADRLAKLHPLDPASAILDLKVCDPAMGSGHFLVDLVDYLADRIIEATESARVAVEWAEYESPLIALIAKTRRRILKEAKRSGWAVAVDQLEDRLIVRRMILKRVIYGVDKNPMAVELAKVALWLHTFTVGAPLSFLDHHLRCGDSLFGMTVRGVMDRLAARGALLINAAIQKAKASASGMLKVEQTADADLAEVHSSIEAFAGVEEATKPLAALMSVLHALDWIAPEDKGDRSAVDAWLDERFGDPLAVAAAHGPPTPVPPRRGGKPRKDDQDAAARFARLLAEARELMAEQRFLHWEVAFPGVWTDWESADHRGGFDAVVGNPPWDRIKFQEVEWFAARRPEIAHADTAARRKGMVEALQKAGDPLAQDYDRAVARAEAAARMARASGDYPLLSRGDINIYSLFVERALALLKPDGLAGLLTPSGIASDMTASVFFRSISTAGRLAALFDFENRRPPLEPFFPAVDSRFKFCVLVVGGRDRRFDAAACGFFLRAAHETADAEKAFALGPADFALVNPNTGTAPIFRSRRDAALATAIYRRAPVLVDRSVDPPRAAWPVKYATMFHMTNDSGKFVTRAELEKDAYPVGGNRWKQGEEEYVPLYVGRMIHQFDHRAASVRVNPENLHNPALSGEITLEEHADPDFVPTPQFWVKTSDIVWPKSPFENAW